MRIPKIMLGAACAAVLLAAGVAGVGQVDLGPGQLEARRQPAGQHLTGTLLARDLG